MAVANSYLKLSIAILIAPHNYNSYDWLNKNHLYIYNSSYNSCKVYNSYNKTIRDIFHL